MELFAPGAPWAEARSHIQVFKLYGEWVAYHATDAELKLAVEAIRGMGLALAVEAGPLDPPADCGAGIEGFAGLDEGAIIAERILEAGGTLDLIALDEPLYYAHFYDGPGACRWPLEKIAQEVDEYLQFMRGYFPNALIGDTEPSPQPLVAEDYRQWLLIFREVAGYDLDFLHLDIDWSRPNWPETVKEVEDFGAREVIPVGIIYNGNFGDPSDEVWISITGERVKRYELEYGGRPAHVLFQSWMDHPDFTLPESEAFTYTSFIRQYFTEKSSLGYPSNGLNANLAFNKPVSVSRFIADGEGQYAVDGDIGTLWSSGDDAPQWIEIDLEAPFSIAEMHLVPSQYPEGVTVHNIYVKGPDTGNNYVLAHTFDGFTRDSDRLSFAPGEPLSAIQYVRIETIASPSWVAWREIEIMVAGE